MQFKRQNISEEAYSSRMLPRHLSRSTESSAPEIVTSSARTVVFRQGHHRQIFIKRVLKFPINLCLPLAGWIGHQYRFIPTIHRFLPGVDGKSLLNSVSTVLLAISTGVILCRIIYDARIRSVLKKGDVESVPELLDFLENSRIMFQEKSTKKYRKEAVSRLMLYLPKMHCGDGPSLSDAQIQTLEWLESTKAYEEFGSMVVSAELHQIIQEVRSQHIAATPVPEQ